MFDFFNSWRCSQIHNRFGRRRPANRNLLPFYSELLEMRCLLSASGGQSALVETGSLTDSGESGPAMSRKEHGPKKQTYPSIAGTWEIVTHSEGVDIQGTLILEQNGKKITGTLTNAQQPPGKFKAKFVLSRDGVKIQGTCENRVVSSGKPCKVEATAEDRDPERSGLDYLDGRFAPRDANGEPADFSGQTVFDN